MAEIDWLSRLLQLISVTGQLEVRCNYGAPWRVAWPKAAPREIPYHVVLRGRAILEDPETRSARELRAGDIVLMPHGSAHVLHDGSGEAPLSTHESQRAAGWMLSENEGQSDELDLLCGRFFIAPPHDRLIHNYLPTNLVVRTGDRDGAGGIGSASRHLASLLELMRTESGSDRPGSRAMLQALSSALFTLVLRAAGFTEANVIEIVALVAMYSLTNFFNNVFDPDKDFPAVAPAGTI